MRAIALSLILCSWTGLAAQTAPESGSAEALARALQHRYDTVRDFSADFTHTYAGGVLRKQVTERGSVAVKKPGRMRWTYTAPEQKLFVSDGRKMYSYLPHDKQVIVSDVPPDDDASTAALFLAGKGHLTRDFAVSFLERPAGLPGGTRALKLVPRTPQPEYEHLVVAVDEGLRIRAVRTIDTQGGTSTITLANLKENTGLPDNTFAFRIPRGVDVIANGPAHR